MASCLRPLSSLVLLTLLHGAPLAAQAPAPADLVKEVRAAIAQRDTARGNQLIHDARAAGGDTPVVLAALSWMARGALAGKDLDRAEQYATETYDLATAAAKRTRLDADANLEIALGAAIEVLATVATERGARADAIAFLEGELATYRDTPIHKRIQKNLNLLGLAGEPAPPLEQVDLAALRGRVVLLFFWAHWCSDCKAQAPIVARLLEKHGRRGLSVVAPTQRYGYIGDREDVGEAEELAHIGRVIDESYAFLRAGAAPIAEANMKRYGVSTTPTLVLLDRRGIVRHYRPGRVPEAELDALIDRLLAD